MPFNDHLFQNNLAALSENKDALTSLLSETDTFATVLHKHSEQYNHFFTLHRTKPVCINPAESCSGANLETFIAQVLNAGKETVILIGAGSGEHITALLNNPEIKKLVVLEKNISMIRLLLGRHNVQSDLLSQRLRFFDPLEFILNKRANYKNSAIIAHPVLGACYNDVSQLVLSYDDSSEVDVLLDGALMIDDWAATLRDEQQYVYIYPPNMYPVTKIRQDLAHAKVNMIWSINRIEGMADLAEQIRKPYCVYEIDPDLSPIPELQKSGFASVFTFRRDRETSYSEKGWRARFLPLATKPERFQNKFTPAFACDLSFTGASMFDTGEANLRFLEEFMQHPLATHLLQEFREEQQANPEVWKAPLFLKKWLSQGFPAYITVKNRAVSVLHFVSEWSGACHRIHFVKGCHDLDIQVWGDPSWEKLLKGTDAVYRGFAKHRTEIPAIYASSRINLDITRVYQPDVATLRLFDVLAARSVVITNLNTKDDGLSFANPGLIKAKTVDELRKQIQNVLSWTADRYENYTEGMYQQIMRHHTFAHRYRKMRELTNLSRQRL